MYQPEVLKNGNSTFIISFTILFSYYIRYSMRWKICRSWFSVTFVICLLVVIGISLIRVTFGMMVRSFCLKEVSNRKSKNFKIKGMYFFKIASSLPAYLLEYWKLIPKIVFCLVLFLNYSSFILLKFWNGHLYNMLFSSLRYLAHNLTVKWTANLTHKRNHEKVSRGLKHTDNLPEDHENVFANYFKRILISIYFIEIIAWVFTSKLFTGRSFPCPRIMDHFT